MKTEEKLKINWQLFVEVEYSDTTTSVIGEPSAEDFKPILVDTFKTEEEALKALKNLNPNDLDINYKGFIYSIDSYVVPVITNHVVKHRELIHMNKNKCDNYYSKLKSEISKLEQEVEYEEEYISNLDKGIIPKYISNASEEWVKNSKKTHQRYLETKKSRYYKKKLLLDKIDTKLDGKSIAYIYPWVNPVGVLRQILLLIIKEKAIQVNKPLNKFIK